MKGKEISEIIMNALYKCDCFQRRIKSVFLKGSLVLMHFLMLSVNLSAERDHLSSPLFLS